ncbi:hypothetical protein BDV93DRAFT_564900 [Ceratobasidium sp. AG-I]|nr:hypothetical protein BDV93DRAFT_564900 [Ceratobasidium sp. AG-I]
MFTVAQNLAWPSPSEQNAANLVAIQRINSPPRTTIPRGIPLDPATFDDMISVIVSQYTRMQSRVFRPLSIGQGVVWRASDSDITRWTMYILAKISQALMDGSLWEHYLGWIVRFHREIVGSTLTPELSVGDLCARLSGLHDLCAGAYMISDTRQGYALFQKCALLAVRLMSKHPDLWASPSTISISRALHSPIFEIGSFVLFDTIAPLALGIPPLLNYDTTRHLIHPPEECFMEKLYGCPAHVMGLLAQINAWRSARWLEQPNPSANKWKEVEEILHSWTPPVDSEADSHSFIGRFAVQESWQHAVFIYLYMGMCGVNSGDPRVQMSVRQVVQLASTVEPGDRHEHHFFIPCLIAGAAARQEKHRAVVRIKIIASRGERFWVLPGADFVPVLDHLWHGAGVNGSSTTWDDYVNSRCAMLPIDA